jgi:hypothetical protein
MLQRLSKATLDVPGWEEVPARLAGEFGQCKEGLYVFLFDNPSLLSVFDANPKPKIVVHAQGMSLKPGKFEQTLVERLGNYNWHLRETLNQGAFRHVFYDCFVSGYVLDLSSASTCFCAARVFERYWIEGVNLFLRRNNLLLEKQVARAEWRYLQRASWTSPLEESLRAHLGELALRIKTMIAHGEIR